MDTQTILHAVTLICAGYILVVGVIQLITKKCVGGSKAVKQANSEDVKKFAVVTGIVYILGDIAIGAIYERWLNVRKSGAVQKQGLLVVP